MTLNDFFSEIVCINLDRRKDRWEKCLSDFDKLNIHVNRFSATDGQKIDLPQNASYKGELGGSISHLNVVRMAKEKEYENILILEDDVEFNPKLNDIFPDLFSQVPKDWDILFFGGNHVGGTTQINKDVKKLYRSYAIHAYAIRKSAYDIIIQHMDNKINTVLTNPDKTFTPSVAADYFMADLHRVLNVYCFNQHIAWQKDDFSDIQQTVVNYNFLK